MIVNLTTTPMIAARYRLEGHEAMNGLSEHRIGKIKQEVLDKAWFSMGIEEHDPADYQAADYIAYVIPLGLETVEIRLERDRRAAA